MAAAGGRASRSLKKAVVKRPAYASLGSVVNAQIKAKLTPSSKCNLGKFLGIPEPPTSDTSKLISMFIKLNNLKNPGSMKKDSLSEEKLRSMLEGKERVGMAEIAKLLAQQYPKPVYVDILGPGMFIAYMLCAVTRYGVHFSYLALEEPSLIHFFLITAFGIEACLLSSLIMVRPLEQWLAANANS
ncbi:unnamed protein product [Dovyalis caffra]|uniref:SWIB domain-containing protein n=1 Tax=Dovyalis caffra TaxID=77055 RepID=A0AAV1RES6_9ROSI|nr:unnamed protein product [Dovyalis caffra]